MDIFDCERYNKRNGSIAKHEDFFYIQIPCVNMFASCVILYLMLVGHRLVAGTYKSSGHDRQLVSTVQ